MLEQEQAFGKRFNVANYTYEYHCSAHFGGYCTSFSMG
jgi:hypothetical protein